MHCYFDTRERGEIYATCKVFRGENASILLQGYQHLYDAGFLLAYLPLCLRLLAG